jgi:hypothetical protein
MIAEPELAPRLTAHDDTPGLPVTMPLTEHWDS